jgi:hypothetical protein
LAGYVGMLRSSATPDTATIRGQSSQLDRYAENTGGQQNEDIPAP